MAGATATPTAGLRASEGNAAASSSAADAREPNALDAYTERSVTDAAAAAFAGVQHEAFFGHDGSRLVALQRAAAASGFAAYDTATTHLCLHPTYGAWFALRAVVEVGVAATRGASWPLGGIAVARSHGASCPCGHGSIAEAKCSE